jgi:hypothetical protein
MLLNFNMNRPEIAPRCINRKGYCIKVAAVHEFGHALGFFHQYNESDGQITVKCQREPTVDLMPEARILGQSDFYSVVNTCNPRRNGNGELSQGDILALQRIYNTSRRHPSRRLFLPRSACNPPSNPVRMAGTGCPSIKPISHIPKIT